MQVRFDEVQLTVKQLIPDEMFDFGFEWFGFKFSVVGCLICQFKYLMLKQLYSNKLHRISLIIKNS